MADDFVKVTPWKDFIGRFRAAAATKGHDLASVSDEQLLDGILKRRPNLKDSLVLPTQMAAEDPARADAAAEGFNRGAKRKALAARTIGAVAPFPVIGDIAGEFTAQSIEKQIGDRESYSPGTIVAQGVAGAVPYNKLRALKNASPLVRGALEGATAATVGEGTRPAIEEGRLPTMGEIAAPATSGLVLGGAIGKFAPGLIDWMSKRLGISPQEAAARLQPSRNQTPTVPPVRDDFRTQSYLSDVRNTTGFPRYQEAADLALRTDSGTGQMSLPGFLSRPPEAPPPPPVIPGDVGTGPIQTPEGQQLLRFMQEGAKGSPTWTRTIGKRPRPKAQAAPAPEAVPTPRVEAPVGPQPTHAGWVLDPDGAYVPVFRIGEDGPILSQKALTEQGLPIPALTKPKPAAPEVTAPEPRFPAPARLEETRAPIGDLDTYAESLGLTRLELDTLSDRSREAIEAMAPKARLAYTQRMLAAEIGDQAAEAQVQAQTRAAVAADRVMRRASDPRERISQIQGEIAEYYPNQARGNAPDADARIAQLAAEEVRIARENNVPEGELSPMARRYLAQRLEEIKAEVKALTGQGGALSPSASARLIKLEQEYRSLIGHKGDMGQRGAASPELVQGLATMAGGLGGAALNPEDPLEGALIGAAASYALTRGLGAAARKMRGPSGAAEGLAIGRTPKGEVFARGQAAPIPESARIKTGNIRAERLNNLGFVMAKLPPEIAQGLSKTLSELSQAGELEVQRRGAMPVELIQQLAQREKVVLSRAGKPGTPYNAEELNALAMATVGAQQRYNDIAERVASKTWDGNPLDTAKLVEAQQQVRAVTATLSGGAAEAGRALRSLQLIRSVTSLGDPELIARAIKQAGGEQKLRYIAQQLSQLPNDPVLRRKELDRLLADSTVRRFERVFQTSLLSSGRLHVLNGLSNALNTAVRVGTLPLRAAVGSAQRAAGRDAGFAWEAINPAMVGLSQGARDGMSAAKYVWKYGLTPQQSQALLGDIRDLNQGRFDLPMPEFDEALGPITNPVAWGYNRVLRALGAADIFFRTANEQMARHGLAATVASNEARGRKLTGEDFRRFFEKRYPEIVLKGDADVEVQSLKEGLMSVYQEDLGRVGNTLLAMREHEGTAFLFPFIRTTLNIFRQGIEMTPFAPLSSQWRQAVGGNSMEQAEAIGRTLMGTLAVTGLAMAHNSGVVRLTGALPAEQQDQARFLNQRRQPYSFEITGEDGRTYSIPFRALGPIAIPISMLADAFSLIEDGMTKARREAVKAGEDPAQAEMRNSQYFDIIRRLGNVVSENTVFGQFMDLTEVVNEPTKALNYLSRLGAATLTPFYGALNDLERGRDQIIREKPAAARLIDEQGILPGLATATVQQIPILGSGITGEAPFQGIGRFMDEQGLINYSPREPLRDPLGAPLERFTPEWVPPSMKFAYHALMPLSPQLTQPDMGAIQPLQKDWHVGKRGAEVPLTIKEEGAIRTAKGEATAAAISRLENDPRYRSLPKERQQQVRDEIVRRVREQEARKQGAKAMREAANK